MINSLSIATRAALTLILIFSFYILAIGVALGLLYLPYAQLIYTHSLHPFLLALCILGAIAIFSAIRPRRDRYAITGQRITKNDQPSLFLQIENIAKLTRQRIPEEVYVVPDVTAAVVQRGGVGGVGGNRVLILGLPLLGLLTRVQFKSVLAHEFGHYDGGDTVLGPWLYRTRIAVVRTVVALLDRKGRLTLLSLPFLIYSKLYLRLTLAISRHQELVADRLAARVVGARALIEGLQKVHGLAAVFPLYWQGEFEPTLQAGACPPLCEGFQKFIQAPEVGRKLQEDLKVEMSTGRANPYDTHPPLRERVTALERLPAQVQAEEDASAATWIEDLPALERQTLAQVMSKAQVDKLKPISWSEAGALVYVPHCESLVKANHAALSGILLDQLPALTAQKLNFGRRFIASTDANYSVTLATKAVAAAIALLLVREGWTAQALPGEEAALLNEDRSIQPNVLVENLVSGKTSASDWQKLLAELGLTGVDLGSANKKTSDKDKGLKIKTN